MSHLAGSQEAEMDGGVRLCGGSGQNWLPRSSRLLTKSSACFAGPISLLVVSVPTGYPHSLADAPLYLKLATESLPTSTKENLLLTKLCD